MRSSRFHRLAGTLAGLVLLLTAGAAAAFAKEGVEVTLAAPISRDAQPGDVVPVFFTLGAISDSGTTPLGGSDVFIRLYGPTGASTKAPGAEQSQAGLYKAMIEIPAGGATRAEFGLHGVATDANGKTVASDIIWPYDGILVAAAIPAPVQPDPATGGAAAGTKPGAVTAPGAAPGTIAAPATADGTGSTWTITLDLRLALAAALAAGLAAAGALLLGRRRRIGRSAA